MKLMPILMLSILSGAVVMAPERANATVVIDLDLSGGNCNDVGVGVWSLLTATCTLTSNLPEGVEMAADGLTLDCDGHSITGNPDPVGIELNGRTGVVITNCTVTNFDNGISLNNSDGNVLKNNNANGNLGDDGISLVVSHRNTLRGNRANENLGNGIGLIGDDNTLRGNTTIGNVLDGIHLEFAEGNTLQSNTVVLNLVDGISLMLSNENILKNNKVDENQVNGIHLFLCNDNTLKRNSAIDNVHNGFYLEPLNNNNNWLFRKICG